MRKHVMAAKIMKYIEDVNMATGEIVEIMPDGTILRDRDQYLPFAQYGDGRGSLPENWREFMAIRKMVIPANGWRTYPGFAWMWVDKDYNIGIMPINDISWRISSEMWLSAYNGTMKALIGDLRESGKIDAIMSHVYHHNIAVYTTWSGHIDMTIMVKGQKQWLGGNWLGDRLLRMAAEVANVPDGRFYVANGTNKTLGQIINEIKSGTAYDEYWAHRDADLALGNVPDKRKDLEVEIAWSEIPQAKDAAIDCIVIPDRLADLVRRFKLDTQACDMVRYMVQDALLDGAAPSAYGILEWIQGHKVWFEDRNLRLWRDRAIAWLKSEIAFVPLEIFKIKDLGNGWFENDPHYKRQGTLYGIIDHNRGVSTEMCAWPRCVHFRNQGYYTRKTMDGRTLYNPQVIYASFLNGELISR